MFSGLNSFFLRRTLLTVSNTGASAAAVSLSRAASTLTQRDDECVLLSRDTNGETIISDGPSSFSPTGLKYSLPAPLHSALTDNLNLLGQIPSHEEITTVLDTLFEQPERLLKLLSPKQLQTLRGNTNTVAAEIGALCEAASTTTSSPTAASCDHSNGNIRAAEHQMSWSELASQHNCVICMDVLAAPVITNCGHSYCGECLATHMESCAPLADDVEVAHTCPTCRAEITSVTYERGYDTSIAASVERATPCAAKDDYHVRRDAYMKRRQKEPACIEGDYDEAGVMFVMGLAVAVLALIVIEVVKTYRRSK